MIDYGRQRSTVQPEPNGFLMNTVFGFTQTFRQWKKLLVKKCSAVMNSHGAVHQG